MLADLLKDYNTIQVLEWLIIHERWSQNIWQLSEDLGIVAAELKPILVHLLNHRLVYYDPFYNSITVNQESKMLGPLRHIINTYGLYGEKECQLQVSK